MADKQRQHQQQGSQYAQQHPRAYYAAKAATFLTMGGSLLVLSGLVLTGTVVALVLATPIFVIFSPVLVPAVITASLIVTGFLSSGGFGVAAVAVLSWIYKYVTGKRTPGVDQIDQASHKLAGKNEPGFGQFSVLV